MLCAVVHRRVLRGNDILASCALSAHRTMWAWNFEKNQTGRLETIAGSWCTVALLPIFDPLKDRLGLLARAL